MSPWLLEKNIPSLIQLWTQRSDPVLHIELRRWADLLVIAPLDANTLGKITNGICDNLLVRTWNYCMTAYKILCQNSNLSHHFPKIITSLIRICSFQTCVVRAWDISRPLLFCPAMNTAMWLHPITAQQVSRLKEFGYVEIPCIAKKLVCGDEGGFFF